MEASVVWCWMCCIELKGDNDKQLSKIFVARGRQYNRFNIKIQTQRLRLRDRDAVEDSGLKEETGKLRCRQQ